MEIANKYSICFGTVRGVIGNTCCKPEDTKYDLEEADYNADITSLQWGRYGNEILFGKKNGLMKVYDISAYQVLTNVTNLKGNGAIVGIDVIEDSLIISYASGHINIWNENDSSYFSLNLVNDSTLEKVCHNKCKKNIVATGGEVNDIMLWDIETKKCLFKAKSMGHDNLNLHIPTSVRDICFLDEDNKLTACCTKEGHVLIYDERAQRRPVCKFLEPKASYTTMCPIFGERQCFVGTTKGYMQLLDMKIPSKCIKTFKSFGGSVTNIVCDPSTSIVATVSLDRFLRIHNIDTKILLYKEYLKQSLTKLIVKPIIKEEMKIESQGEISMLDKIIDVDDDYQNVDVEYEELFDNMETISESKLHKTKKRQLGTSQKKIYKKVKKKLM